MIPALWVFGDVRQRVYVKSFGTGGGGPERHGDFNAFDFWRPEFWWDASTTR